MTGRSTAEELSGNVYTYSTHESICYVAAATQFCSAFYNSNGSQYSSCFYHRNGNSSHEQTHLSLHLLGVPRPQLIPTVLRFQTLKCNLMSIFRMCGSMSCSTLALQNPYPMLVSFSGIPTHDVSPMALLCHFLAYSQVG